MTEDDFAPKLSPEDVLRVLNEFVEADPLAAHRLMETRVPCGQKVVDHPSIVVNEDDGVKVGPLGLINGFLRPIGMCVWAHYEDEAKGGKLYKFSLKKLE